MGAYCHFILINERELLGTKLTELARFSSQHKNPEELLRRLLEQSHIEKPVEEVTIGDFSQLKDLAPFFYYKLQETTKKLGITDQAFFFHHGPQKKSKNPAISDLIAEALNEAGGSSFMWVVDPGDIKVQGFERWLFNFFSKDRDGITFPLNGMPEFVEIAPDLIPSFMGGYKRIMSDLKKRKDPRGDAPVRDHNLETLQKRLGELEKAPDSFAGNLTKISALLQQFINTIAIEDMNHNIYPEILRGIARVLEELDIRARIPEDPQECLNIIRDTLADPRKLVWDFETVTNFCQRVKEILKPYSMITTNKVLLDAWNPVTKKRKKPISMRDSMRELRISLLDSIQADTVANPSDLSSISTKLQAFVSMVVAHEFSGWINPKVIDPLKEILNAHEIKAYVAIDWPDLTQYTKDHLFDTRPIVWDAEAVGDFCKEVKLMLQQYSPTPIKGIPEFFESGDSLDQDADQFVVTVLEDVLGKLEEGIKKGFNSYLCIISD